MTSEKCMPALAAKMAAAAKMIGFGVPKDGQNQQQRYSFTSAAAVKMRAGPALAAQGIAVSSQAYVLESDYIETQRGGKMRRHLVKVILTFTDGESCIVAEGLGEGSDSLDKAVMKAYTAAEKYAYIAAFSLAMGEDPEWDDADTEPESEPQRAPAQQQRPPLSDEAFARALEGTGGNPAFDALAKVASVTELRAWMREHVPTLGRMPAPEKRAAMAAMVARGAAFDLEERDIRAIIDEIRGVDR
jgi:hypothetical protein